MTNLPRRSAQKYNKRLDEIFEQSKILKAEHLEYEVVMRAINNAKNNIAEDTFIDPYDNEQKYTNAMLLEALESAEEKIMKAYLSY